MQIKTPKLSQNGLGFIALGALALLPMAKASAVNLTGAGATFPYPLYSRWFDAYNKATGTQINYQPVGSGAGIKQLKAGTVDFGASDAPLSNEDLKAMPGSVAQIPTVAGAVVLAYNLPGVGGGLRLTADAIAQIYLGQIKTWNDPRIAKINPAKKLPNLRVTVARRSDGSGTTYIFTNYLKAVNSTWSQKVGAGKSVNWPVGLGGKGNAGVAGIIRQTPGAIGYVELAYAVQNKVNYAVVRNRSGAFVAPSIASTTAAIAGSSKAVQKDVRALIVNAPGAKAYPISGMTYLLVYRNQRDKVKGRELTRFINWAMGAGQSMASPLLYAPLPKSVVSTNQKSLKTVR